MKIKAHAKINLCLNVVGKREDGYHELEMIMVPLALHDVVHIETAENDQFTCSDDQLVMDESNTIVKAVVLLREKFQIQEHFHIHVDKHIPAQAGLAGGSSDGAAVLRGITELLNLPITREELAMLGKQIGADVPFCVMETSAIVKGIGEKITPISLNCPFDILLVKPSAGVPTGKAFSMLDFTKCDHPNCDKVAHCLCHNEFENLQSVISNSLEYSAFKIVPEIKQIEEELKAMGFTAVLMSGSGSTVFALTRDKKLLDEAAQTMSDKGYFVEKTQII